MTAFKLSKGLIATGLAAVLVGCGGGSETTKTPEPPAEPPAPSPIDVAKTALNSAVSNAMALPAGTDTATQLTAWQMVKTKAEELQAAVTANNGSAADLMAATTALGNANTNITDLEPKVQAINTATNALNDARNEFMNLPADATDTEKRNAQEKIKTKAEELVTALQNNGGTNEQIMNAEEIRDMAMGSFNELNATIAVTSAAKALEDAVLGLSGTDPTPNQVKAVRDAIEALQTALNDPDYKGSNNYQVAINLAIGSADTADRLIADGNKEDAKIVYHGIDNDEPFRQAGANAAELALIRKAEYANDQPGDPLTITIGDPATATNITTLTQDRSATGDSLYGWEYQKHTKKVMVNQVEQNYEAHVYSDVESKPGKTFAVQYNGNFTGNVLDTATTEGTASRIDITGFTPDTSGVTRVPMTVNIQTIGGTYHGVSGTYSCIPAAATDTCAISVATSGFNLGGVTTAGTDNSSFDAGKAAWTFSPTNPTDKVIDKDDSYASYGWWIKKVGNTWTISAFNDYRGTAPTATADMDQLNGSATYKGGAAGQYSIYGNPSIGTNESGSFTAKATLNADFTGAGSITGTIDNFEDNNGNSKNWSVKLERNTFSAAGVISKAETAWTIDGTTYASDGEWTGEFTDGGTAQDAPKTVIGRFFSEASGARMIGGFGATKD